MLTTPMRKPVIAGNWKMYKTRGEAIATARSIPDLVEGVTHCEVGVAPPFTALRAVADALVGTTVHVAAQDVAAEQRQGAFTGEVSAEMLVDAGATHCIVGHSERRQFY